MDKPKKVSFETVSRSKLKEFNRAEVQGWIVDQFVQMEWRVNQIIINYFKPTNKEIFETVLLNSSIINIGGKAKILCNIGIEKKTLEKFRRLASIRNGFSHSRIGESITLKIPENEGSNEEIEATSESTIQVLNSKGIPKTSSAYEFLKEFLKLRNELREELS